MVARNWLDKLEGKPVIYKPERYAHVRPVVCSYCLVNPSMGRTVWGTLGCRFCQGEVDRAIEERFEVVEEE